MKKNNTFLILILIFAVVVQGIWLYSIRTAEDDPVLTYSTVLESIQEVGELNTLEMYFHDIVEFTENKVFRDVVVPFTTKSFIFTIEAKVKAGVNLQKAEIVELDLENSKIEILLPEYTLTSVEFLSYDPYQENDALFNKITNEDIFMALDSFKNQLESKAIGLGILDRAQANGDTLLIRILKNLGFETVIINYLER